MTMDMIVAELVTVTVQPPVNKVFTESCNFELLVSLPES